jgi:type II secretory pathway pseudopilin PulG
MRKRQAGFSVLELLIIGAIIAILCAIGIVNYMNAINRARQKRTVNDIRVIAQAWEARATDTQTYMLSGYTFPSGSPITYDALVAALRPTYLRDVPRLDGWNRALQFAVTPDTPGPEDTGGYAIRSAGRDGTYEASYPGGVTSDFDCDIVWANGNFVSYPDVSQGD